MTVAHSVDGFYSRRQRNGGPPSHQTSTSDVVYRAMITDQNPVNSARRLTKEPAIVHTGSKAPITRVACTSVMRKVSLNAWGGALFVPLAA